MQQCEETRRLEEMYRSGMTLREIGEQRHLHFTTVRQRLLKAGVKMRSDKLSAGFIEMMRNDWNADKDPERMAEVYGYDSGQCLRSTVSRLRREGHGFKLRRSVKK